MLNVSDLPLVVDLSGFLMQRRPASAQSGYFSSYSDIESTFTFQSSTSKPA